MTDDDDMSTCEACAAFEASQDTESVGAADNLRFARIILAALGGAPDAVALIVEETKCCYACTARMFGASLGVCVAQSWRLAMVDAAADEQLTASMTEDEKWEVIHQYAIRRWEQIALNAADLEAGPGG